MTEEKSCKTCGYYNADMCVRPGGCCFHHSKWQPIAQGKPMEKIQYTQQEWASIIDDLDWNPDVMVELEQKGYIRKSTVEEAEEEYRAYKEGKNCFVAEIVMDKMYLAIQELKKENARLKK